MAQNLTDRILDVLRDLPPGTHLCHFYQTPQDILDVLVPYFAAGMEKGEKCLWILDDALPLEMAQQAMAKAVPEWDRKLSAGSIEFFEYTEWYVRDGQFDEKRVLQLFLEFQAEAMSQGFTSLRLSGNTLWARDRLWADLLDYERHVGQCFCGSNLSAVCTYPLDKCSAADVVDVANAHDLVLIRRGGAWDILESATVHHMREELRETHERLKTLAQQMVQVEQRERRRISQALHDGLQQTIVAIQLKLAGAIGKSGPPREERLHGISDLLHEALQACRTLTTEISPPILHERGLVAALRWLAAWFEKQHRLKVHVSLPAEEPALGESERVTLFEITRELLFNVVKHADVWEATVSLREVAGRVELAVADDGRGCDPAAIETMNGEGHFGLFNIRERLLMMNGEFFLESSPGTGSRVGAYLPRALSLTQTQGEAVSTRRSRTAGEGDALPPSPAKTGRGSATDSPPEGTRCHGSIENPLAP